MLSQHQKCQGYGWIIHTLFWYLMKCYDARQMTVGENNHSSIVKDGWHDHQYPLKIIFPLIAMLWKWKEHFKWKADCGERK